MYKTKKLQCPLIRAMPPKLYKFLRNNKCLREFIKNADEDLRKNNIICSVPTFAMYQRLHSHSAIGLIFQWVDAPEGATFWVNLSRKYRNTYNRLESSGRLSNKKISFNEYINYLNQLKIKKNEKETIISSYRNAYDARDYFVQFTSESTEFSRSYQPRRLFA